MKPLNFAVFGAGFWANFQLAGWLEIDGVKPVAIVDKVRSKAEKLADKFGIKHVYNDAEELLDKHAHELDFIDIITDIDTHLTFAKMGAERGLDVVCQKPMASSINDAVEMVNFCHEKNVRLFINENFRWQSLNREVKSMIEDKVVGDLFKVRISFCTAFPVFDNQPALAELDQFILTDCGPHGMDLCRFLFGEARTMYCLIKTVNPTIKGEDVANVLMEMENGIHCFAEYSFSSILEEESFPQYTMLLEGTTGSIKVEPHGKVTVTTKEGSEKMKIEPESYSWADPEYMIIHSSIVAAQRDILVGLKGGNAQTTGDDNLNTIRLIYASYESAATGEVIEMKDF
ncbi:Gfo/Idh/MocA family protein [Bacteroidota bacterium]